MPTSLACSSVARRMRDVNSSGSTSWASTAGSGSASRRTNSAVRFDAIRFLLADSAAPPYGDVRASETLIVSLSRALMVAVALLGGMDMGLGLWSRWVAMHGVPRAFMAVQARRGDPLARVIANHGRGQDPYPLMEALRAQGP